MGNEDTTAWRCPTCGQLCSKPLDTVESLSGIPRDSTPIDGLLHYGQSYGVSQYVQPFADGPYEGNR